MDRQIFMVLAIIGKCIVPYRPLLRRSLVACFLQGGVNKSQRSRSLYKGLTVNLFILAVIRAGVEGAGVKFGPA